MKTSRLEAFSDGVIAILITIMVLELHVPHGVDLHALLDLGPVLCAYVLSFVFLGIYWNNHHHLVHAATGVDGRVLWANLHLLFWLSLVPFTTAWMGENTSAPVPTAIYGVDLLAAGIAYLLLQRSFIAQQGPGSRLAAAIGRDWKGNASAILYLCAVGLAFVHTALSQAIYVLVAAIWLIPDRRIERTLTHEHHKA